MSLNIPKRIIIAIVILILLAGAAIYKVYRPQSQGITATGTIEVTKADITPKVSGYIRGLKFDVGTKVQAGQTVLTIERKDLAAQLVDAAAGTGKRFPEPGSPGSGGGGAICRSGSGQRPERL